MKAMNECREKQAECREPAAVAGEAHSEESIRRG